MKRILALILAGAMSLAFAACSDGGTTVDTEDTTAEETTTEETTAAEEVTEAEATAGDDTEAAEFDYSKGLDENGFFEGITASDIVTLPAYKGVEMDISYTIAAEADIQKQIDGIVEPTYEQITDRAVVDGDTVNIDYVGSVDGVEFQGGSTGGAGTVVTIGVTNYIDDFLEQLIGHMPGETFNVEVTFPEDYGVEELNGKDAVFVTTVNYVCGDTLPAVLTDEIAANYGFETKEELIADISAWIVNNQKTSFANEVLAAAVCEEIPESVVNYFVDAEFTQLESYAQMYGMTVEEYITAMGYESAEAYREESAEYHKANAVTFLAAQAIAEVENITVTDEDIAEIGISEDEIAMYGKPYIKQYILSSVLIPEFIIENAKVAESAAQ